MSKRPGPEPVKPALMTETEYQIARVQPGVSFLKQVPSSPRTAKLYLTHNFFIIEKLSTIMPRTFFCVQLEGFRQILEENPTEKKLDNMVQRFPQIRSLKDPDLQKVLRVRAGWEERKELFEQLRTVTSDKREWSLLLYFDDLDRESMLRVIEVARKGKEKGYEALSDEDKVLLMRADQLEFLDELLTTPEERRAEQDFKERKRKALEETRKAIEEEEGRRRSEKAVKWEAARQRQLKIGEDEKKANALLRAALQLNSRGGFDKQVRQRLQEIIDKYPDTPSAKKAQQFLDKKGEISSKAR